MTPFDELTPLKQACHLLSSLIDPDACWFDHHGGCQAHGFLSLEAGEMCPNAAAKTFVEKHAPEYQTWGLK